MTNDSLILAVPDLVAFVRRDGTVLKELGGRRLGLPFTGELAGKTLADLWPEDVAALLQQMIRRALHDRGTVDGRFVIGAQHYEVRIAAQGRERALCVIRNASHSPASRGSDDVRENSRGSIERRELFMRLDQSLAEARLRERPLAVCMIHLQGMREVGGVLDFGIVEQLAAAQLHQMSVILGKSAFGYAGRVADDVLLVVAERFANRQALHDAVQQLLELLSQPVAVGDATFTAAPSAGLALWGDDGSDARQLLENARASMLEARRGGTGTARFYSEDLQLRSPARLDIEHELREAISHDRLALRYAARHCLDSGQLIAIHAYLRWPHPARGEVAAAEFLPIAESTGLATPLSQWALARFVRDIPALRATVAHRIRFSFSALKSHLASDVLQADVKVLLGGGAVALEDFELRVSERVLASLADPGATLRPLAALGVSVTVDEFGRGFTSLPRLARLPVSALQLDRRLALSASTDPIARRAATAVMAVAGALGFVPMSAGIDDESQRQLFKSLGCAQGLGDAFDSLTLRGVEPLARRRAR